MATAGSLISNMVKVFGDPDQDFMTDAHALNWLDRAQRRFCHKVLPLDEHQDFAVVANQTRYDLATDVIIPVLVMWYKSRTTKLEYTTPDLWYRVEEAHPSATGTPERYTVIRRQLTVGPQRPTTASGTANASGAIQASNTTFSVVSVTNLRSRGFIKINSEVMEVKSTSGTTLTVTRGVHGTTAASHASADTVTQMDLIMLYRKTPAVMSATTTSPDIPAAFHDYLEKYALYLGWLAQGNTEKASAAMGEFQEYEDWAVKTIGRRAQDGLLHIQEKRHQWRGW